MPSPLIIGTDHAFQRHQDLSAKNAAKRNAFDEFLSATIAARKPDGIAEEAGDDQEVCEYLKAQEAEIPEEWRALFAGTEIVDSPQPTIAKLIAGTIGVRYADIRPTTALNMTISQRDEAMARATHERFGNAQSVLVIVGDKHRTEVARILHDEYGWTTETVCFL